MSIPKTTFISTKETEAQRLLDIAVYVANRFWQKKNYFLLPYDPKVFTGREIYFPDFNYPGSFWSEAKRLAKTGYLTLPLAAQISFYPPETPPDFKKLELAWRKVEADFWRFCFQIYPKHFNDYPGVDIWVTRYQRLCSFADGKAWVHYDQPAADIAEAILSGVLREKHFQDGYSWEESEAVVDDLLTNSALAKLFPDFKPTLAGKRSKAVAKYAADSKAYFAKLGYTNEPIFTLCEGKIMTQNGQIQDEILKNLIAKNGQILTFEEIGNILWGENAVEKYSEWAIAKTIQRLRSKINSLGIVPDVIETKRGQGYWLRN